MFDLVIRNGTIIDGSGKDGFIGDIAVQDESIVGIGRIEEQGIIEIDGTGMIVCPGFIDAHTHSDLSLLERPECSEKITQGVTTEILGNCGFSVAPIAKVPAVQSFRSYSGPVLGYPNREWSWESYSDYLSTVAAAKPAVNFASLIGHGTLRAVVMGFDNRKPTEQELERMAALLDESMQQGALGLSTGLVYVPGTYSDEDELIALARVVVSHGGIYATHLRNQADGLVDSVEETIRVGMQSGVAIHISHHKTVGERNQGLVHQTLSLLDETMEKGIFTSSDMYPYLSGSTTMAALLPAWLLEGGIDRMIERLSDPQIRKRAANDIELGIEGWENRLEVIGFHNVIVNSFQTEANKKFQGLSLKEVAQLRDEAVLECMFNLLIEENGEINVLLKNSTEADLQEVLRHPRTVVGSDGLFSGDTPHPRLYGTFPRVLHRYAAELNALSLTEAIHKMTGLTSEIFHLGKVGFLRSGFRADIVVFDPQEIKDLATFEHPKVFSSGIKHVVVGGKLALQDGSITGVRNGCALIRQSS
ncbi:N-acyl-D-amino-acid deacylase family protein [Ferviditalea candida]|uniref:D-aminoacylase n=1 Tax=Ferviditalea candida TaxID=3108399 RepID=A0ABU5ZKW3_9BACL|nr:D-aminoacylase [Paenibacillaceae bacterium T2]